MTPNEKMAAARAACECEPAWGIAFACPATCLPKMGHLMLTLGPSMPIPYPLPVEFACPRHEIMGW